MFPEISGGSCVLQFKQLPCDIGCGMHLKECVKKQANNVVATPN